MNAGSQETTLVPGSGWGMLIVLLLSLGTLPILLWFGVNGNLNGPLGLLIEMGMVLVGIAGFIGLFGLMAIQPNDARVLLLFGNYRGTVNKSGFYWVNPFYSKKKRSLKIRNFQTGSTNVSEKKMKRARGASQVENPQTPLQGQRSRWQSDRDFGRGGLESGQHGRSSF